MPGAPQQSLLDRTLAQRPTLMRAPVLQRTQPAPAPRHRDAATIDDDTADPPLDRHIRLANPAPTLHIRHHTHLLDVGGFNPMVSAGIRPDRYAETGHLPDNQVALIAGRRGDNCRGDSEPVGRTCLSQRTGVIPRTLNLRTPRFRRSRRRTFRWPGRTHAPPRVCPFHRRWSGDPRWNRPTRW